MVSAIAIGDSLEQAEARHDEQRVVVPERQREHQREVHRPDLRGRHAVPPRAALRHFVCSIMSDCRVAIHASGGLARRPTRNVTLMTSTQEQAQEAASQAKDKAVDAAQQARGRARAVLRGNAIFTEGIYAEVRSRVASSDFLVSP